MSKAAEYRAKAVQHIKLAETCKSDEVRQEHLRMAGWLLALADDGWLESDHTPGAGLPIQPVR